MTTPATQQPIHIDEQDRQAFIDYLLQLVVEEYELETENNPETVTSD